MPQFGMSLALGEVVQRDIGGFPPRAPAAGTEGGLSWMEGAAIIICILGKENNNYAIASYSMFETMANKYEGNARRKNNPSSSWIFLEITCWYWPLGFSWI